jgi:hypothetical protein
MSPHEEIGLREVYQEVKKVSDRLRVVEIQLAAHRAEHRGLTKYKAMLYPTMATAAGAVVAILVK